MIITRRFLTRNTERYWQIEATEGTYDGLDLRESDLSIVPTSVTYARRINLLGHDVLGFGIFVPTQDSIDASIIGHTEGILNVDLHATYRMNTKAYYGLLGYGIQLVPGLHLGVSANMVFLQTNGGANISAYLDPGGTYQSEIVMIIKNDLKALAFSFGMGLQFSPWEGHWIGAYIRTPAYRSYATVEETQISQQVGPIFPDGNQSQTLTTSSSYRYLVRPALCSLGYGYTRKNAWAWSIEGTLHFTDEDSPNRVIDVRTGIELYVLRNVILRGGFFTDYSQKDTVTQSSSNDEKNDFYGASLSISIGNELNPLRDSCTSMVSDTSGAFGSIQLPHPPRCPS